MKFSYTKAFEPEEIESDSPIDFSKLFNELYLKTNGDVEEALKWLRELYDHYNLGDSTNKTFDEILDELEQKGLIERDFDYSFKPTKNIDQIIQEEVFNLFFKNLSQGLKGSHTTAHLGKGNEKQPELRNWQYGDDVRDINFNESIKNSLKRNNHLHINDLHEDDLVVQENEFLSNCSTVLMIDISHSMILYGEDRITPAKMVALALVEFIQRQFPKDTIDVITFGNEAKKVPLNQISKVAIGPFHTNTCDGLKMAQNILRKRKNVNKQIFMITDGKPSAVYAKGRLYKNSFGLDPLVINKTLNEAQQIKRNKVKLTTFMIAQDQYLIEFIEDLTRTSGGTAFYTGLDKLGEFIFRDYSENKNRRRRI